MLLPGCSARAEPFPAVIDEEVTITLQRTACFGSCPDYTVTIDGKGNVRFVTRGGDAPDEAAVHRAFARDDGVLVAGAHSDRIDPQVVRDLVARFRAADFFGLKDVYRAAITDNPTYVLTLDTGTRRKTVVDYVGRKAGMPPVVTELEQAVDAAAGTGRWIDGADGLVEWLAARDFDFASAEARGLVLEGAYGEASEATLIGLIERGAALDARTPDRWGRGKVVLGEELVVAAVERGRAGLFSWLAARGWVRAGDRRRLETLFAEQAAGCSAALVQAFASQGLAIDAPGEGGDKVLMAEEGETALAALAGSYGCKDDEARLATAAALLDAGADPNHRDAAGETAVYDVEYLPLLDLLYARGANADVTDKEGNSPALSSWTDAIVLRHLQAGARPVGRYYDGRTLGEQMKHRPMPQVAAWLEAHGRK
jgi:hypothetical protein